VNAQLAVNEAEIKRLQYGQTGGVCDLTGYCAPSSSSNNGPGGDGGTGSVERTSREGTLGQCNYVSDDGYKVQKPCDGGDHYWENVDTGAWSTQADAPNDGHNYRRYNYSSQ
ncbi:MAG TPA: hypothetical protein VI685_15245, partial [Candidatus Angelobacter sp.]